MPDTCNHTSVGVLVHDEHGRYLLFQRQKFPIFKAPPAGHVDELNRPPTGSGRSEELIYLAAAVVELWEETGLRVQRHHLTPALTGRTTNECRRTPVGGGGHWHLWRVYTVAAPSGQQPQGNGSESRDLAWYTPAEIAALPDLEPVWRDFFTRLQII